MARNTQFYSQANHSVVVTAADGSWSRVLKDFDGDEAIGWEPNSTDRVSVTEGFDQARISFSSGTAGKMTVKLKPTSSDVGFLTRIYNLRTSVPQLVNVTITSGVNEIHTLINAGVNKEGSNTGGTTMSSRTFTFIGEQLKEDESE
jgi:hypothetical protein